MKKILLPIFVLAIISALVPSVLTSCKNEKTQTDTIDTTVIKPQALMQDTDSTAQQQQQDMEVLSITGEVVDGAKSQVTIKTKDGEFHDFSYENLDPNDSKVFYHWSLDDNESVTIKYTKVKENGVETDRVISIQKAE